MELFKIRLKQLMQNISPEKLSKELHNKISANTIRNYLRGDTVPNSFGQIQILANYFNVSTDYIQGNDNKNNEYLHNLIEENTELKAQLERAKTIINTFIECGKF